MSDELQKKIFSKNLNKYINLSGKKQNVIAADINVIPQTLNSWCTGQAMPRIGKIQLLADYFGINKSDLLEDKSDTENQICYINQDAKNMAQFLSENPDYKPLVDSSLKVKKEDIPFVKEIIDRVSNNNNPYAYIPNTTKEFDKMFPDDNSDNNSKTDDNSDNNNKNIG